MTRTGTLVPVVSRCAALAALVYCTGVGQAQTRASHSPGWTSSYGTSGEDNPFRDDAEAGAWQPVRPNHGAQRPSSLANSGAATPARWLAPTQTSSQSAANGATSAKSLRDASLRNAGRDTPAKPSTSQSAATAPKPFVPPTGAQQLVPATERTINQSAAQSASGDRAAAPAPRAASAATPRAGSAAHVNPPLTQNTRVADNSSRTNPRPVANRPRAERPVPPKRWDEGGWIRPIRQVAYQFTNGPEMELPMPGMPAHEPGMYESYGPNGYPQGDLSEGQWIGAPYGGPGCDGNCNPDYYCPDCEGGDACGPGCGDTCSGGQDDLCSVGVGDEESCHTVRVRIPRCQEIVVFGGVHGFKGPLDRSRDSGNFGFQEGINFGAKIPFSDCGYQLGYQATQSQLSGDADTGISDAFTQSFFTTGVFRRTRDGFQGGIAWDLLLDERDSSVDLHQLRAEFGFVDCGCHEFGVMVAIHLNETLFVEQDNETTIVTAFQPTDQYLVYYRMHGKRGGEGRLFAGVTDDSDAIIGADFLLPLMDHWSLQSEFTYLIPGEDAGSVGARQEAWNIGINLVWHWKGRARKSHGNPYRPLFNVANNGSLIVDDRP